MCYHQEPVRSPEPTFTQFSSTTKDERVTIDVRPAPASDGHIVALFNHSYPERPIVMRLPRAASLDAAKLDAEALLDAYDSGPLVALVKLDAWLAATGATPYPEEGYRAGEGIFSVA